jgi:hypothetical protein
MPSRRNGIRRRRLRRVPRHRTVGPLARPEGVRLPSGNGMRPVRRRIRLGCRSSTCLRWGAYPLQSKSVNSPCPRLSHSRRSGSRKRVPVPRARVVSSRNAAAPCSRRVGSPLAPFSGSTTAWPTSPTRTRVVSPLVSMSIGARRVSRVFGLSAPIGSKTPPADPRGSPRARAAAPRDAPLADVDAPGAVAGQKALGPVGDQHRPRAAEVDPVALPVLYVNRDDARAPATLLIALELAEQARTADLAAAWRVVGAADLPSHGPSFPPPRPPIWNRRSLERSGQWPDDPSVSGRSYPPPGGGQCRARRRLRLRA